MRELPTTFLGGASGAWRVSEVKAVRGQPLPRVARLAILEGPAVQVPPETAWALRGVASHERYVTRAERASLVAAQSPLGRPEAVRAALIPIAKSEEWWALPQDERRAVFEERSHHIATGLEYLPAVARRLYHSRDLGEPFDFLTWFEFSPSDGAAFEELLGRLRATEEWTYVTREVEVRLTR